MTREEARALIWYFKIARDKLIIKMVSGIEGTPNQKYRETLRESGVFNDKRNPLLDLQSKEGVIKTNLPENKDKEDDYDPWDSKNWGL